MIKEVSVPLTKSELSALYIASVRGPWATPNLQAIDSAREKITAAISWYNSIRDMEAR